MILAERKCVRACELGPLPSSPHHIPCPPTGCSEPSYYYYYLQSDYRIAGRKDGKKAVAAAIPIPIRARAIRTHLRTYPSGIDFEPRQRGAQRLCRVARASGDKAFSKTNAVAEVVE
jgi:hypothetical protein